MDLDIIKLQTTWNDAAGSLNSNFANILQAITTLENLGGGGIDEVQLREYLENYYTKDEVNRIIDGIQAGDIDLSNYYTKDEIDHKGFAYATDIALNYATIDSLNSAVSTINTTLGNKADTSELAKYLLLEKANQTIKGNIGISGNLVVAGDVTDGGEGASVVGISAIKVNGQIYRDDNGDGVIDLGTIGGGLSSVSWNDVIGKPTKLSEFTNDLGLGSLAYKNSLTASDVGALSASGGTISGANGALEVKRTSTSGLSGIKFSNESGVLGYIGVGGSGSDFPLQPTFYTGSTSYALIHSGNIGSQTVSLAYGLKINEIADVNNAVTNSFFRAGYQASNRPDSNSNYASGLTLYNDTLGYTYQLAFSTANALYSRRKGANGWESWKTIAFTDSTVAAANKLATSSGTVVTASGTTILKDYNSRNFFDAGKSAVTGYNWQAFGDGTTDNITVLQGGNATQLKCNGSIGLILNNHGNVTIGDSDYAGTSAKLYVRNGDVWVNNPNGESRLRLGGNTYMGRNADFAFIWNTDNTHPISFGTNSTERMRITNGGNILIGTTTDSGAIVRVSSTRAESSTSAFSWTLGRLADNCEFALEYSSMYGLYTAIQNRSGNVAMQVGRSDGDASAYNLLLQPLGGNVGVGTISPAYKLDVNGTARVGNNVSGGELLRFNMDRPWAFYQQSSGSGSNLALMASTQNKAFFIKNSASENLIGFYAYDTPYVNIISRAVLEKTLEVAGAVTMASTLSVSGEVTIQNVYIKGISTNPYIRFTLNGGNWYCQAYTTNGVDGIFLGSASAKSLKVDVNGNTTVAGNLIVKGDISA